MPVSPTYPGVYIEEVASGVRTITGVPTSITAFVGSALRGPVESPQFMTSFADFERTFGGLSNAHPMSYSVYQYYLNGGSLAVVVRLQNAATKATITLTHGVVLQAKNPGLWGEKLRARVDYANADADHYNLTIRDTGSGDEEKFLQISKDNNSPNSLAKSIHSSNLAEVSAAGTDRPDAHAPVPIGTDPFGSAAPSGSFTQAGTDGDDGSALAAAQYTPANAQTNKTGLYALLNTDIFNILVLPPPSFGADFPASVLSNAAALCADRRAMLLVDPPVDPSVAWNSVSAAVNDVTGNSPTIPISGDIAKNAALYFPYLRVADPVQPTRKIDVPPSGAVAGVYARTDVQRGVWKAPAGTDASLNGVPELSIPMTDLENGRLNPIAVNCLRSFPIIGRVVWGARTMQGADATPSDWKYVPVRRLALFIEESLYRGTKWVVFEPNDEPLWAQIRLNVGAFMQNLFRQGAFQGSAAKDAYFVKCDRDTTTQNHINLGIVNIHVGFAPLKPAEFVIIRIQQMAGQVEV
jgi:phage tail sheath protein FI